MPGALSAQEKLSVESSYIPSKFEWSPLCRGIDTFRFENTDIPLVYHVVRIDLTEPTLALACVKGNVPSAARNASVRLAFNATQFESKFLVFNRLKGVCRIDGVEISKPVEKYCALLFDSSLQKGACGKGFRASIVESQTEEALLGWRNAVGGFFVVLKDGIPCQFKVESLRARVGVGLTEGAKTMYVLVVEENNSSGLSYGHCALLFKALGCRDAMEFDGGHSTALYVGGKSVLLGYPWRSSLNAIVVLSDDSRSKGME
ncbi:MAG: phosphodiester glycosidase family protein [Treponema sp.]|nr:phosphodiester glycosidase family protein [Treponema sp.]